MFSNYSPEDLVKYKKALAVGIIAATLAGKTGLMITLMVMAEMLEPQDLAEVKQEGMNLLLAGGVTQAMVDEQTAVLKGLHAKYGGGNAAEFSAN